MAKKVSAPTQIFESSLGRPEISGQPFLFDLGLIFAFSSSVGHASQFPKLEES
jgi:hypothetical protein